MSNSLHRQTPWLKWAVTLAVAVACLYLVLSIYASGEWLGATGVLIVSTVGFVVYLSNVAFAYRYLFPGLAAMVVFVLFPLLSTTQIGFTNYSSAHLLNRDRAKAYLLEQTVADEGGSMDFTVHADSGDFRIVLASRVEGDAAAIRYLTPPLSLAPSRAPLKVAVRVIDAATPTLSAPLDLAELLSHRDALKQLQLELPDRRILQYTGVREFGPMARVWLDNPDGSLTLAETRAVYRPNLQTGYFETAAGERAQPGFKVMVGVANYTRMFTDPDFRGPFLSIFIWTVLFSGLTLLFTLAVGMPLAVLLNWEALRFRGLYRTLLFLPYAVPAFISILVFKGLFNQNFGEINNILATLFNIKPAWFADPTLAKVMILIVNTWLGYPYVMVLCSGLIKSIPADLYEASAIAGASPLTNFFKITAPLIVKPLTPLLITIFAFNFNNFVVIALLTDGRPDYLNTKLPAGTTDILVSYTYRIAFQDSGQDFGLAAAVSTLIFLMVALMSVANMKIARLNAGGR
jgi:maltose/maltodextrin transport system permease protein